MAHLIPIERAARMPNIELKAWRQRMGFSTRDACDALGCSRTAFSRWENGKIAIPRYIGLACAALALGMNGEQK